MMLRIAYLVVLDYEPRKREECEQGRRSDKGHIMATLTSSDRELRPSGEDRKRAKVNVQWFRGRIVQRQGVKTNQGVRTKLQVCGNQRPRPGRGETSGKG